MLGDPRVGSFCSDNADELVVAAKNLGVPHGASQEGMPQTNGSVEREVHDMLIGTRTLLGGAGATCLRLVIRGAMLYVS